MRRIAIHLPWLALAVWLGAGCASTQQYAILPAPRSLGAQHMGVHETGDEEGRGTTSGDMGAVDLNRALAMALMHSPALAAYSHDVRAAESRLLQAGLMRNPTLELEVEEVDRGGTGFDNVESTVAVGQWIELGGKRRGRSRVAEAEGELAGWEYEQKRLEVLNTTARRFVGVMAAQRRVELSISMVTLSEKTAQAVGERVTAGKESPLQRSKVVAELEMTRIGLLEAKSGLVVARNNLAAQWGGAATSFETVEGRLDVTRVGIPSLSHLQSLVPRSPSLARWESETRLARAALAAQKADAVPDLKASLRYVHYREDETDALAFGVGFDLPLFDRNQGHIAAARHVLARVESDRTATAVALLTELAEAHAALSVAERKVMVLRSKVVPAMQEAFDAAHEGYRQGKFGLLDMLDAQRGLFEAEGAFVDGLEAYHMAWLTIQQLTGTTSEELTMMKMENQ
ncbi:MAG: TolC family protein [Lentisphaerae bacterium]|nr:TolC family protein [Lentisphaerota bacterium]